MPADLSYMYEKILEAVGGADNISGLGCCMTRLRFTVKDEALVNVQALRKIQDVAGYFYSGVQHQLIVGPSTAAKLTAYFNERHHFTSLSSNAKEVNNVRINPTDFAVETKASIKRKYATSRISQICGHIGNIFLPLIPAYIGCGLLIGISNILSKTLLADCPNTAGLISVLGQGIFFYLNAIVGYNASKEFGGTPAFGVAFAGILNAPALANISLFGTQLQPGKGGVLAVLFICWLGSLLEKKLRNVLKGSSDMFLTPLLTIAGGGLVALLLIQPLAGKASSYLAVGTQWMLGHGGVLVGAALSGTFLPLVMLGIHQSLIPIHQQLLDTLGANPLFPILCMAGAGQVGAALAVLCKTNNNQFKRVIKNALPVGILGIGEPLIYGVTLPLFKPFIGACLGAAFGGALVAAFQVTSAIPFGVSGVVLLLALSGGRSVLFYALGYLLAVGMGFVITYWLGFDDPPETVGS